MIRAKRPQYNVQHNRHVDVEVEVELSPETLAAAGAAVCLSILVLRWLADISSAWWIKRQAGRQGVDVELPPCRDPFSEPSVTLTLLQAFCSVIGGPRPLPQLPTAPAGPVPAQPAPPAADANSVIRRFPAPPISSPTGGLAATIAAMCVLFAQAQPRDQRARPDADGDAAATEEALPD